MAYLEQRRRTEHLGDFGAEAGEGVLVEEDILLDLFRDVVNGARIAQPEGISSVLEAGVDACYPLDDSVGSEEVESFGLLLGDRHGGGKELEERRGGSRSVAGSDDWSAEE